MEVARTKIIIITESKSCLGMIPRCLACIRFTGSSSVRGIYLLGWSFTVNKALKANYFHHRYRTIS